MPGDCPPPPPPGDWNTAPGEVGWLPLPVDGEVADVPDLDGLLLRCPEERVEVVPDEREPTLEPELLLPDDAPLELDPPDEPPPVCAKAYVVPRSSATDDTAISKLRFMAVLPVCVRS